ncbi:hypothetical protein [Nocardia panacis]|nr:hypothetical protein [Nocardia panacis]
MTERRAPAAGVAMTAIVVAVVRERESRRAPVAMNDSNVGDIRAIRE